MPDRPESYEVGILGAGAVGCSIAYHLARHKIIPVVVDREGAGTGASGATAAGIWVHTKTPPAYARQCLHSAERYPGFQDELGPIEYMRTGGLRPAFTEADAQAGIELARSQAAAGLDVRWLSREEVLRREPALSPDILGATYSPHDGSVNPFLLVRRLMSATRRLGGTFLLYSGHVAVRPRPGGFQVESGRGEIQVRRLVLAAGAWAPELGRQVGITIPVRPVRGHILVTEKLPPLLRHTIAAARQQITGEVLLGSTREDAGMDRETTLAMLRLVARDGVRLIPALAAARVIRAFAGIRPIPVEGMPILGPVRSVEGLFIAVADSGITLCPLLGESMATVINQGSLPEGLEGWSPERLGLMPARSSGVRQDSPEYP